MAEDRQRPADGELYRSGAESAKASKEKVEEDGSEDTAPPHDANTKIESIDAWWKVVGGFLICFNIWGLPISFGAFESYYTLELLRDYDASAISWIGTLQGALLVLMGLVSGPLYDLGYWSHLYVTGSLMTVFGMFMLSLSTQYYQVFLSQGICTGIGCGLLYIPLLSLIGSAFSKRRALAMGIITSGIAMGGIIFTIVYIQLLPRLGFAWMVRVMAFINLGTFLIAAPTIIRTPQTSKAARQLFDRAALTDGPFLIFAAAQFFVFLGYLVPFYYIPIYAQVKLKTDLSTALYVLVGSQAGSLVGRIVATPWAPVIGTMVPWLVCCAISGVLCFAWVGVSDLSGLIGFAVLYGFFSGALIALPPSIFPVICPDPKKLGSRMGISYTSAALAFLVGSPIAGALIKPEEGQLLGMQLWSGAILLLAAGFLVALWIVLAKRTGRKLV